MLIFEIAPHAVNLVGTKLGVQAASRAGEIQNIEASGQSLQILGSLPMGEDAACGSGAFEKTGNLIFRIDVTSDTGLDVTDPDYSLEASGQVTFTQTLLDGSVHQIQAPIDCNDND